MGTYVVEEELLIPEDVYLRASLKSLKEETIKFTHKYGEKKGQPGSFDKILWFFEIADGEFQGEVARGECDAKVSTHPNNRFRLWVEALMQGPLSVGDEIDPHDLVGLECMVQVKHRTVDERIYVDVAEVVSMSEDVPF